MLTPDALLDLTDPATISRGRAYARTDRVVISGSRAGAIRAEVQGTDLYRVVLAGTTWSCDCPVGATGVLCKHCVAVVITIDEGVTAADEAVGVTDGARAGAAPVPPEASPRGWLHGLPQADLLVIVERALSQVHGFDAFVAQEYLGATGDVTELAAEVEETFKPRRSFYEYRHANAYAAEAEPLIAVIEEMADEHPTAELLTVVERAITLTVRTITRSDDSSGYQGSQVHSLLDAHVRVAGALAGSLDRKAQRRLATWLHKFAFSDTQDFFNPKVDAYAGALEASGLQTYTTLVERTAESGKHRFAVEHARGRLAILTGDAEQIINTFGGDLTTQHEALAVVAALDEAGLHDLAVVHAYLGLAMPRGHRHVSLVDRAVLAAHETDDVAQAVELRQDHFDLEPTSTTFGALRVTSAEAGDWDTRREGAEATLAARSPHGFLSILLAEARDDAAWNFAFAHPEAATRYWEELCTRRALTAPADTLPIYTDLITSTLTVTDRRSYSAAARLLVQMRVAAIAAGREDDFEEFMVSTAAANKRRPTCTAAFKKAGLI